MLARDTGMRLVRLVDAVPDSRTLLHGDPHPSNIVFDDGRLRLIDMEDVGFGHPATDLANARSRLLLNYEGSPMALKVWESILTSYFADADPDEIADIDSRIAILSEIERFDHMSKASEVVGDDERGAWLRACMDRSAKRVEELLPQVSRLDF